MMCAIWGTNLIGVEVAGGSYGNPRAKCHCQCQIQTLVRSMS